MGQKVSRQTNIGTLKGSPKIGEVSRGKVKKLALLKKKIANKKQRTTPLKQVGVMGLASTWASCIEDLTGPKTLSLTNKTVSNAYRKGFKRRMMLRKPLVQEIGTGLDKGVVGVALSLNRKSVRKGTCVHFIILYEGSCKVS